MDPRSDDLEAVRDSVLYSLDTDWDQLTDRMEGLTDAEFLWQPHANGWSVTVQSDGTVLADLEKPDPVPPPFTTIAWRMWHMGPDCLDSYSMRAFGTNGTGIEDRTWTDSADEARDLLNRSFQNFRTGVASLNADELLRPLGDAFGPFGSKTNIDLALHAEREIIHHGAEIGLLRDWYSLR